ncbi:phage tail baseplate protein [Endozoicomonas sp. ALC066]|uniref:GTA baseplate fiber-binding domain-containing protein n=1 Tax=Endozoicomonas sp. ALC066 TaxID=3403078 RepID=UPI003BB7BFF5
MSALLIKYLISLVISILLAELLRPNIQNQKRPATSGLDATTAEADRTIPVIWGKPVNTSLNLVWYGDVRTRKITKTIKTGLFSKKKLTVGFNYYCGLHIAINSADPDAKLLRMWYGQNLCFEDEQGLGLGSVGDLFPGQVPLEGLQALLGIGYANSYRKANKQTPGQGLKGYFNFCPGGEGTPVNYYLKSINPRSPSYSHVSYLVFPYAHIGESNSLRAINVQVRRLPKLLGSNYHDINGHANPAEILYECLKNEVWGLGLDDEQIGKDSFLRAAQTLYNENFGLSLMWKDSDKMVNIFEEVLRHVDGLVFTNSWTGKVELRLLRDDVNTDTILHLNESNILNLSTYGRSSTDETSNEVRVVYSSLDTPEQNQVICVQDLGDITARNGQIISTKLQFPGITDSELAALVATRELRNLSHPSLKVSLTCNREAYYINPGDRVKFSREDIGIKELVLVVLKVDYGDLESQEIAIEAVQDVFFLGTSHFTAAPSSEFVPPNKDALPVELVRVTEVPYLLQKKILQAEPSTTATMVAAKEPSTSSMGYDLYYSVNGSSYYDLSDETSDFTPCGTLASDYFSSSPVDTSGSLVISDLDYELESVLDADVRENGENLILIGDEIMAVTKVTAIEYGVYRVETCWRGLLDTVISDHFAGEPVWLISSDVGFILDQDWDQDDNVFLKLRTGAMGGQLDLEDAPPAAFNPVNRFEKPYPVTNVRVNNSYEPELITSDIRFDFNWRNRLSQKKVIPQTDASVAPEENSSLRLRFYNIAGNLKKEVTGVTETSYTLAENDELDDNGGEYFGTYDVELTVIRDGVEAYQSERKKFQREEVYQEGDMHHLVQSLSPAAYWRFEE